MAGGNIAALEELTCGIRGLALATGTSQNYRSMVKSISSFCDLFGFGSLPSSGEVLTRYVTYSEVVCGRSEGTIRNHLSAIRREHLSRGLTLPTPTQFFPLSEALKGAKKFLKKELIVLSI